MSTRGLIGYRATKRRDNTNNVFGIYNHESSEFIYKGLDVLEIYCDHLKKDFIDIFKSKTWDNSVDAHVNDTLSIFSLKKRKILKLFKFLTKRCFL
ncbi:MULTISPECIES: hypothetical protein [unclassified Clostridioides]|uniref:hypothetical protein n=1 Tax=unclassified Clostridioides TaxID=2635829 RepID=UPI001D11BACA|nr:hypothetical protein [Clostridioides sp. ES-S-0171-01]MCC0686667.1 hypothetical protein [Clostridioides sp. ES-S-0056-01]MCC0713816.1 hypothetical protein [Clostridioides sp. ES-S-0077-01]UDN55246.1 hypothetical protein JJC02_03405 [Clostridioides sp. ES-S-0054-01]